MGLLTETEPTTTATQSKALSDYGGGKTIATPTIATAMPTYSTESLNREVDAPTETIEGRMKTLLDSNSPVIEQARNRALQTFHQRGLLDTSMAAQAAEEAVTSKAIEIAGPDAKTYSAQGLANQSEKNKSTLMGQEYGLKGWYQNLADQNKATLTGQEYGLKGNLQGQTDYNKSMLMDQEYGLKGTLQGQTDDAAYDRAKLGSGDALVKVEAASAEIYGNWIQDIEKDYWNESNKINSRTDLDTDKKTKALEIIAEWANERIVAQNRAAQSLVGWKDSWALVRVYQPAATTETPKSGTDAAGTDAVSSDGWEAELLRLQNLGNG